MDGTAAGEALALSAPLIAVPGIGPARARVLAGAGVHRVGDLIKHFPHRYEDRSEILPVAAIAAEGAATVRGRLRDLRAVHLRGRRTMVRGRLEDGSGGLALVWFNRPYLVRLVRPDEPNREYLLSGPVRRSPRGWEMVNPSCEPADRAVHGGRIVPIYPALAGLGPAFLRRLLGELVPALALADGVADPLPEELRRRHGLPPVGEALRDLHLPGEGADLVALNRRRSPAHCRVIYGELLELQLELALLRAREVRQPKAHAYRIDDRVRGRAREILPFRLTAAQRRVLGEIAGDLASPYPMLRLLQGDVGSGKTIVAVVALVLAMESGLQGAFMAPTELLAEQHFRSLTRLLGGRYRLALVTGSSTAARRERRALARGEAQLAIGTHALIEEATELPRLGLAVIDEQHRFGVEQRLRLQRKGDRPDLLVMTATPIPRSLALTAYGDLELSVLDELPPGRTPVSTRLEPAGRRREVYRWLREELAAGAQAFVVFPLIEGSDAVAAAAVEREGEGVRALLSDFPSAVLHGRTPAAERERVMRAFRAGEVRALVATTVVEVGVDVPAATLMVIESAERFGLAQLHQLRGRVGRGGGEATCVALYGRCGEDSRRRLEIFAGTTDGFALAEADLRLRGPGELLGTRQAGLPAFHLADLVADQEWLLAARDDARELIRRWHDPELAPLRERAERRARRRYRRFGGG